MILEVVYILLLLSWTKSETNIKEDTCEGCHCLKRIWIGIQSNHAHYNKVSAGSASLLGGARKPPPPPLDSLNGHDKECNSQQQSVASTVYLVLLPSSVSTKPL